MPNKFYPRVASFRTISALGKYLEQLGAPLPFDEQILTSPASPLAQPLEIRWHQGKRMVGNRFAVQPMEGWDGEPDGKPSPLTRRRWIRFGASGAKLIWGGEAIAVAPEARANPNQLLLNSHTAASFEALRKDLIEAHYERFGRSDDLIVGLQLTHSGRFSQPWNKDKPVPIIAYHHPFLDAPSSVLSSQAVVADDDVEHIVVSFGEAARLAQETGFDFVDLKHCHGYLCHEFLSAHQRSGRFGGSFENRTRLLRDLVSTLRNFAPRIEIGVRLSAYDTVPYRRDEESGVGQPASTDGYLPYRWGFGVESEDPIRSNLEEPKSILRLLDRLGVHIVNITASSPYYAPHLSRPALFPPCDGYLPPEDPLMGVVRLLRSAKELKQAVPELAFISTGWTYLQNFLPHFAQAVVRAGWTDVVGLGRMMLSYPELPADVLEKGSLDNRKICRSFSDCTNGPRKGLISGCYPLDPLYRSLPEATELKAAKLRPR